MNLLLAAGVLAVSLLGGARQTEAADCPFDEWRTYKNTELRRTADRKAYFWITSRTAIDADGAPKAYHPDDVGKPCGATGAGLDCPSNAGYPNKSWWPTVLASDPTNPSKAFVQPSGPAKGFFVSKTALQDSANGNERDTARYVDASTIPYLVFPRPFFQLVGTGKPGDLGMAFHLETQKQTAFIVADIGPDEPLGESSIALFKALGGNNPNPRNGSGVASGKVLYLVFPRSVDQRPRKWPMTQEGIEQGAETLLDAIGGMSVLQACATLD
ncbi:glycoside hydrolase family 75 protein [Sinorhizobium meliloti]|uniref:glycoside hydrolase family 75 protein n=1 Tax=Rhizobium meliloti TaxID=382 RepID=UPI000487C550|nr:glycoside hydrolase family 75 protein [Sinorhizobium meliloti]